MATCTLRFLYNAENREFSFSDISPTSTVLAAKQLVVERWPSGARAPRRGGAGLLAAERRAPAQLAHGATLRSTPRAHPAPVAARAAQT